jgi:hypothetical protein
VPNESIKEFDDNKIPIVFNTAGYPGTPLAGGNFYSVSINIDNTGHNIFSTNIDETLNSTPPGGNFPSGGTYTGQLRCAGTRGCHGHNGGQSGDTPVDDETQAMKGAHHGDDSSPLNGDITNVARNYRFLLGIRGKEDSDWQQDNINTSHNEYKGSTSNDTNTISYLCAECHGKYHTWVGGASEVGTASPWLRHPTDTLLLGTGEYSNYTTYNMIAPIARLDPDNLPDQTQVIPGTDIVMCLSCHRAHASPYFKMMRWDYQGWPACMPDCTNGCNVCHTSKD